jgi:DNA-binding beta-propeller fold protein YncE
MTQVRKRWSDISGMLRVIVLLGVFASAVSGDPATRVTPGPEAKGRVRLPNGWMVSPSGRQIAVGDFPLGLAVDPDERFAAVTHSGWHAKGLDIVDLGADSVCARIPLAETWLGVAFCDAGRALAVTTGHANQVLLFGLRGGHVQSADTIALGPPWTAGGAYPQGAHLDYGPGAIWTTGIAADDARRRLYVVSRLDSALNVVDLAQRKMARRIPLGAVPYTCVVSHDGARIYVSLWSAAGVAIVDAATLAITRVVAVGAHATDLVETPDGRRLMVANANENTVSVVDLEQGRTTETLRTSRSSREPAGDTPNGLAIDAAGSKLYVADAGANHLAVFDVGRPDHARALGYIPVGWYPTAVRMLPERRELLVANGKGAGSSPSTGGDRDTSAWCGYISYSPSSRGTLSVIPVPDSAELARDTRAVLANTPALRSRHAGPRPPIRHVFYIIKENRSYDQLLGDLPRGDGDSSLCLFGARVTPNHHALARDFVLLDNTYCDSDGSADGHNWGMAAYATDYVIKGEPNNRIYDFEGGNPLAYPSDGYLWDQCARHGISYRSYGEFVFNGKTPDDTVRAGIEGLVGHIAPHYLGYDTNYSDLDREKAWLAEFDGYDRDGGLPQLSIIRLPNDHTEGTCSGRPTPRAHVAENDLALGRMIERISHSRYWRESLVLVIEDDAANGQDHVDGHRTVALAAGPYVKRGVVDSALYTNCSVLRCIENIFGLPPMSQFDARANGLEGIFTSRPDFTPYVHVPALVDVDEKNLAGAFGQAESDAMDFAVADDVPNNVLNAILWHSVRGEQATLPPLARSGFALGLPVPHDDDDR